MRSLLITVLLFTLLGCGFNSAGTGHEGEAKVAGVVFGVDNKPISCSLMLAPVGFQQSRARALATPQKIYTPDGNYSFPVAEGALYTLSSYNDSSLLYLDEVSSTSSPELVRFTAGTKFVIEPWWGSGDSSSFSVQGTDWLFTVQNIGDTVLLPEHVLTLVTYTDQGIDTASINPGDTLVQSNAPTITLPDSVGRYNTIDLEISSYLFGDVYWVEWGFGGLRDTLYADRTSLLVDTIGEIRVEVVRVDSDSAVFYDWIPDSLADTASAWYKRNVAWKNITVF